MSLVNLWNRYGVLHVEIMGCYKKGVLKEILQLSIKVLFLKKVSLRVRIVITFLILAIKDSLN
jgi:hypothetical protein